MLDLDFIEGIVQVCYVIHYCCWPRSLMHRAILSRRIRSGLKSRRGRKTWAATKIACCCPT